MKQVSERVNYMGKRIVVFGSYVTDLTGRATRFPVPGETVLGTSFHPGPGGKGSNQAVAAFRAGGDVTLVTKLGKDAFGRMARDFYTHEGMDTSALLEDDTHETGAGDAFNGGFITALSNGLDLFEAVRYGNCTGALSVTKLGTAPAMPHKEEIDALYQINYGG